MTRPTEGGRDEYRRRKQTKYSRQPAGEARGIQARGRRRAGLGCRPGQGLLRGSGLAARRRSRRRGRLPADAADASGSGLLDHLRRGRLLGAAGLGPGPAPRGVRHRRRPVPTSSRAGSRSARPSTTPRASSITPGPRDAWTARLPDTGTTARSPRSATRTATAGSSRRSRPGSRAAEASNAERRP